jgi:two-component system, NarL family, sensor kinase
MTNDNDLITFLGGTLTLMLFAFTLVIFLVVHKKKRYQHLLEKQTLENNYNSQLLLSKMEVQEQSFKYFSEEIHDNIGQLLSIVKMQMFNIRNHSSEPDIVNKANDCTELLSKAITDLRNISHTLNSAFVTNAGLVDAVEKDLEYIRSAKEISCTLQKQGEEYDLGSERELLIFRIIQEAISNALKHAAPTEIGVLLDYTTDMLHVSIKDNGAGFDTNNTSKDGIGLNNMYVRADLLKGTIDLVSEPGKGTIITLNINKQ